MRRCLSLALCLLLLVAPACARYSRSKLETKEAVKAAIDEHLAKRRGQLALGNMNVEVREVKFQGDRAEADVVFTTQAGASMGMHYTLRREADRWVVERGASPDMGMPSGHPSMTEPAHPQAAPPAGKTSSNQSK